MKKWIVTGVVVIVAAVAIALIYHLYFFDRGSLTTTPTTDNLERVVDGNSIVSGFDPEAIVSFSGEFEYIGGHKFILYGVADTEQYFFVEKTEDGTLKSVYWIQFEAYLDDNDYSYDYSDSPGRTNIGGYDFYVDQEFFVSNPNAKRRKGTDGSMYRQFLADQGFDRPTDAYYARLVHMTDDTNRKELMIIFLEHLPASGLTAVDYMEGGRLADETEAMLQQFLDKIHRTLSLRSP